MKKWFSNFIKFIKSLTIIDLVFWSIGMAIIYSPAFVGFMIGGKMAVWASVWFTAWASPLLPGVPIGFMIGRHLKKLMWRKRQ